MEESAKDELLVRAEDFLLQERFDDSIKLYNDIIFAEIGQNFTSWLEKANVIEKKPSQAVLEGYSVCLLTANRINDSKVVLEALVKYYNIESEETFLSLAQIQRGKKSSTNFQKGIEILKKKIDTAKDTELVELKESLSSALCAFAELYMSDLCYEPDAEETCESLLSEALQLKSDSIEVFQVSSSFYISKGDNTKAREYIKFCWNKLVNESFSDELQYLPFEFRVQTCRLLVELEEYKKAIDLLVLLANEDDSITEVWLLLSICYAKTEEKEAFSSCVEHCEALLTSFLAEDDFKDNAIFLEQLKRLESLKINSAD